MDTIRIREGNAAREKVCLPDAAENILDTIGSTPLVRLNRVTASLTATVYAKVEFFNPAGSVKDRVGLTIVAEAERSGQLKPGGTIVEATSGNTGRRVWRLRRR